MKKLLFLSALIIHSSLLLFNTASAQAPSGFTYQSVLRDANNDLIINTTVGTQISILQTTAGGTAVYVETHTASTNANGLLTLQVGAGSAQSGTFASIDWSAGPYFIKSETDPAGGATYTITGTQQMMSVPYALYAETSGQAGIPGPTGATGATGPQGPAGADGQGGVTTAGTNVTITGTGTVGDPYVVNATSGTCGLSIGDTYAGGIIFFLDGSGCHGLVAKATNEPGTYQWSSTYFNTWAFASGIYGGAQNTKKSIARAVASASTCPAASVCDNLTSGGYTDWYLPSKDELDMMYVNLHMQGLGGFANNFYWSSTELVNNSAWTQYFNGNQTSDIKDYANYVRAVRAF